MIGFVSRLFSFSKPKNEDLPMWLLVGLGNPGKEYALNRHNIGFMAVDAIAAEFSIGPFRKKFNGEIAEGRIGNERVAVLKPQTYMNDSGQSAAPAARFYKIEPARIIVFHDELDLPPGKIRVKTGGGNAGHNGLRSLDAHLGTPGYVRVRLGIGHPGDKARVHGYVLGNFSKTEQEELPDLLRAVGKNIPSLLDGKESDFMSKIAQETQRQDIEIKE